MRKGTTWTTYAVVWPRTMCLFRSKKQGQARHEALPSSPALHGVWKRGQWAALYYRARTIVVAGLETMVGERTNESRVKEKMCGTCFVF